MRMRTLSLNLITWNIRTLWDIFLPADSCFTGSEGDSGSQARARRLVEATIDVVQIINDQYGGP